MSLECDSRLVWSETAGSAFLLSSHLCIERAVWGVFVQRKAIDLRDVRRAQCHARRPRSEATSAATPQCLDHTTGWTWQPAPRLR